MQIEKLEHQAGFRKVYEGVTPWEIGRPQPPFVEVADRVTGPLLEAGCGTGNAAVFFAGRGVEVTAFDFVETAIVQAKAKAAERGVAVEFLVKDAMTLGDWDRRFRNAMDSGLYHIYGVEDRRRYIRGVAHVLEPGGRFFLLSFSAADTSFQGGVSRQELTDDFAEGWMVESVKAVDCPLNPAFLLEHPERYPKGTASMWFAVLRRQG